MRAQTKIAGVAGVLLAASLALPVIAQEKKADEAKKGTEPAKAKAEKVSRRYRFVGHGKKLHDRRDQRGQAGHAGLQQQNQSRRKSRRQR